MTPPRTASVTKYTVFHVRVQVFLNCDKSKLGMLQAASKVSFVVGLVVVGSVLAQACQSPGGQVSICQLKWVSSFPPLSIVKTFGEEAITLNGPS